MSTSCRAFRIRKYADLCNDDINCFLKNEVKLLQWTTGVLCHHHYKLWKACLRNLSRLLNSGFFWEVHEVARPC
ncbi:hypothetical protein HN51_017586 [Arachis hypogaea]